MVSRAHFCLGWHGQVLLPVSASRDHGQPSTVAHATQYQHHWPECVRFFMRLRLLLGIVILPSISLAQYPTSDFPISYSPDAPGLVSASYLIPKPAGKDGPIVAKGGHFYSGQNRIRFWGVNFAFGGNFPTHEQADKLAQRLSNFGINAVRFHHMDSMPFPGGIFADQSLTKLSDEALDRLDYFIAALKKQGIYSNLNL